MIPSVFAMIMLFAFASVLVFVFGYYAVIGMYAKNNGVAKWWLVFVPFCQGRVLGELADQYKPQNMKRTLTITVAISDAFMVLFFAAWIGFTSEMVRLDSQDNFYPSSTAYATALAPLLLFLIIYSVVGIVCAVFEYIALYRIFAFKDNKNAVFWLLGSIFLYLIPFFIFMFVYMKKPGYTEEQIAQAKVPVLGYPPPPQAGAGQPYPYGYYYPQYQYPPPPQQPPAPPPPAEAAPTGDGASAPAEE